MQFSRQQPRLATPKVVPRAYDIMCGSGHLVFSHPGNVDFRSTVEEHAENYANAPTKMLKSRVAKVILAKVRAPGARVLKKDPVYDSWHVATNPDKVLRDKITNYLRVFLMKNRSGAVVQRPPTSPDPPVSDERDRAGKQVDKKNGKLLWIIISLLNFRFSTRRYTNVGFSFHLIGICMSFCQLHVGDGVCSATSHHGGSCTALAALQPLLPGETQDISVRTIQQMQASPTSGSDSLDSWMCSLFDTLIEEPLLGESTTTKVSTRLPHEMFEKRSFSSPSILCIQSTSV